MAGRTISHGKRLALAATLLCAGPAFAFEGHYDGGAWSKAAKQYSQSLDIKRRSDGRFDVEAVVGTPDCSGAILEVGDVADGVLKVVDKEDGETCTLTIRRTRKGVGVEESDSCRSFHGVSCEYRGNYRRR